MKIYILWTYGNDYKANSKNNFKKSDLTLLYNIGMEVLVNKISKEKRSYAIRKEKVKLSLFTDGIMLYAENPKNATKELVELMGEFSQVTG